MRTAWNVGLCLLCGVVLVFLRGRVSAETSPILSETKWQGEYYNNIWFAGIPTTTRSDNTIDFNWQGGNPITGLPPDNFAIKWRKEIVVSEPVTLRFVASADDDLHLLVNSEAVLHVKAGDEVVVQDVPLRKGKNWLYVEFKEYTGLAHARLTYTLAKEPTPTPPPTTPPPAPTNGWQAEYFNNPTLSGEPMVRRTEPKVEHDWGMQAPFPQMRADNFSVRWSKQVVVTQDTVYDVYVRSHDRVKLLRDGLPFGSFDGVMKTRGNQEVWSAQYRILLREGVHVISAELIDVVTYNLPNESDAGVLLTVTPIEFDNLPQITASLSVDKTAMQWDDTIMVEYDVQSTQPLTPQDQRITIVTYPSDGRDASFWGQGRRYDTGYCDFEERYFNLEIALNGSWVHPVIVQTAVVQREEIPWFFDQQLDTQFEPCYPVETTDAEMQFFENGYMVALKGNVQHVLRHVFAVVGDGEKVYSAIPYGEESGPDPNLVPPSGLRQPTGRIGQFWRENDNMRHELGWATGAAFAFITPYQKLRFPRLDSWYDGTRHYLVLPNDRLTRFDILNAGVGVTDIDLNSIEYLGTHR